MGGIEAAVSSEVTLSLLGNVWPYGHLQPEFDNFVFNVKTVSGAVCREDIHLLSQQEARTVNQNLGRLSFVSASALGALVES